MTDDVQFVCLFIGMYVAVVGSFLIPYLYCPGTKPDNQILPV